MITSDNEYIICPYCKTEMGDCWEWVDIYHKETECSGCNKTIIVWAEYDVTYYAMRKEEYDGFR